MKTYIVKSCLIVAVLLGSSCFLFEQSNAENIGHVMVEAILVADTCGPGTVSAGPTMSYEVELNRSGDSLTWHGPGGTVQGFFTSDDEFCIELGSQWHVRDADLWFGDPGCDMTRVERLCGTLTFAEPELEDEPAQVTSLTARHEAFVANVGGTNCDDQVGISEGQYLALPCQVAYELVGISAEE